MADLVVNTSLLNDRGSDFEKISKKMMINGELVIE